MSIDKKRQRWMLIIAINTVFLAGLFLYGAAQNEELVVWIASAALLLNVMVSEVGLRQLDNN